MRLPTTIRLFCLVLCATGGYAEGVFDTLIPAPREIQTQEGVFSVPLTGARCSLTTPTGKATANLRDRLLESLERAGLPCDIHAAEGKGFSLALVATDTSQDALPALEPLPEKAGEEGYRLTISPSTILLLA